MALSWSRVVSRELALHIRSWLPWRPRFVRAFKLDEAGYMLHRHVAQDGQGRLLVSDIAKQQVVVCVNKQSGREWCWTPTLCCLKHASLRRPWGMAVASPSTGVHAGEIVVADASTGCIFVFHPDGTVARMWSHSRMGIPQGVAITSGVGPSGTVEVLVADYLNHRVCVFGLSDGTHLRDWGSLGRGPGQFRDPTGVCLTPAQEASWVDPGLVNQINFVNRWW